MEEFSLRLDSSGLSVLTNVKCPSEQFWKLILQYRLKLVIKMKVVAFSQIRFVKLLIK